MSSWTAGGSYGVRTVAMEVIQAINTHGGVRSPSAACGGREERTLCETIKPVLAEAGVPRGT